MKERPILFSTQMVRAILEGRKTQTRRVVNPQPSFIESSGRWSWPIPKSKVNKGCCTSVCTASREWWEYLTPNQYPFGAVGDRLWVRETWGRFIQDIGDARQERRYVYAADQKENPCDNGCDGPWRPSIHMPRAASRITLEITGIRAERVQEISEEDILSEGVTKELIQSLLTAQGRLKTDAEYWIRGSGDESVSYCYRCGKKAIERLLKERPNGEFELASSSDFEGDSIPSCETCGLVLENTLTEYGGEEELYHFLESGVWLKSPEDCYCLSRAISAISWTPYNGYPEEYKRRQSVERSSLLRETCWRVLWDSINKERGFGWDVNPLVWVIEFKRI